MREQCMDSSQPPPRDRPSTAAMVGTEEYFSAMVMAWNWSTAASISLSFPAIRESATFSLWAALSTRDWASRRNFFISLVTPEGGWAPGLPPTLDRLAPAEN